MNTNSKLITNTNTSDLHINTKKSWLNLNVSFKKLMAIWISLFIFSTSFCQDKRDILVKEIQKNIVINTDGLKDSIAFYSFSIQIKINKKKNNTIVEKIEFNDSIGCLLIKDYSFLKKMNYSPLISGNKRVILIIPVGVIVSNYDAKKIEPHKIPIEDLSKKIDKLFYYDRTKNNCIEKYIYINPFIVYVDKAIYD